MQPVSEASSRYDHVTSLFNLKELHWLRAPEKIEFNLCGPAYLADSLQQVTDVQSRQRWSSLWYFVQYWVTVPCFSSRGRPGLGRLGPTRLSRRRLPSHHSVLRWRRICFCGPSDIDNMHHTNFATWPWGGYSRGPCLRRCVLAPR